jgi:hypothetical protein
MEPTRSDSRKPPAILQGADAMAQKINGQGGGGIFESRTKILFDHHDWEGIEAEEGFSVPDWLNAELLGRRGGGEDFDLGSPWSLRLQRDGWELMQHPTKTKDDFGPRMRLELDPPFVWQKTHPIRPTSSPEEEDCGP